ncbi:alpha/beta fold hydrolase [Streptomyces sp. NBC_00483]|uniref:alpha/beta fold hydrolase n=1 Tax=Streptomyces sp. NBC_00483 TaxID=2975756 RepID=UPI002E1943E8
MPYLSQTLLAFLEALVYRSIKVAAAAVMFCAAGAVAGGGIVGYGNVGAKAQSLSESVADAVQGKGVSSGGDSFLGTKKVRVDGNSVNVSCSGRSTGRTPAVMLMAGGGDGLDTMAGLQKTLSKKARVCSYDRLGEGKSDKPKGAQTVDDSGKILTGVLDRIVGDGPVGLAGHSMGGFIAARYAPDHRDRVKGLVHLDATIPALTAGINKAIPAFATDAAAELRDQTIAVNKGQNPEKFVIDDGEVRSPRSSISTAAGSGHYIHVDRPDIAVKAVQRVTAQAAAHQ